MAKVYISQADGTVKKVGNNNYFTENIKADNCEKSVTQLSGDGKWKSVHGVRVFVDKSGTIIKGLEEFIGKKWNDIKNLNYADVFTVMRGINRANERMAKSILFPYFKEEAKQIKKEAVEYLDKAIEKNKQLSTLKTDPKYK